MGMKEAVHLDWLEIRIHTSEEAVEAVSFYLLECGLEGVVIEDSEVLKRNWKQKYGELIALSPENYPENGAIVKGYVPLKEDIKPILENIHSYLISLHTFGLDPGPKTVTTRKLKNEEWTEQWKQYLQPIVVTDRILVKPVWETVPSPLDHQIIIELDPGFAFGTGHHITTIQSLQFLEEYIKQGNEVIDVGCGSGILSIAAAKLGAAQVLAIDLDPNAVTETCKHVQLNKLENRIQVECGDGLKQVSRRVHVVVADILAEILIPLIDDLPRILAPGGIFIASGIIKEKENDVVEHLKNIGFTCLDRKHEDDWIAIVAEKW